MTRTTREEEGRINETHDQYSMEYVSPLALPPGVARDGYSYRAVNTNIKGEPNYRVESLATQGWELVPASRCKKRNSDPLGRNAAHKEYLAYKDVIFMEIPTHIFKARENAFHQKTTQVVKKLHGVSNDIGSFSKPLNSINSF